MHDMNSLRFTFASSDEIRSWSSGEVTRSATFDESGQPVKGGLFCERMFGSMNRRRDCGPSANDWCWETQLQDGIGHIELACPVVHPWLYATKASPLSVLLGMQPKRLLSLVNYRMHLVVDAGQTEMQVGQLIDEHQFLETLEVFGHDSFRTLSGAGAVRHLLDRLKLDDLVDQLQLRLARSRGKRRDSHLWTRLKMCEALREQQIEIENFVLDVVPVVSPQLRPGAPPYPDYFPHPDAPPHHLNAIYQRILDANTEVVRTRRILEIAQDRGADAARSTADEMIALEKAVTGSCRDLQRAVDRLLAGSRGGAQQNSHNEPLVGRLQRDIQGSPPHDGTVSPSACSVVVPGPQLELHQCGLPKKLALALYEPMVIQRLIESGVARPLTFPRPNHGEPFVTEPLYHARRLVAWQGDIVWDVLNDLIRENWVLLSRMEPRSREQIQAFQPRLVEGDAIQIQPLLAGVLGLEFNGEPLKVFLPTSIEAQTDAKVLLTPENNLLDGRAGEPAIGLAKELQVGLAHLTHARSGCLGEGMTFGSAADAISAWEHGCVDLHALVKLRLPDGKHYVNDSSRPQREHAIGTGRRIETTIGRILVNESLPTEFDYFDCFLDQSTLIQLIEDGCRLVGRHRTLKMLESLSRLSASHLSRSGLSIGIQDLAIPSSKPKHVARAEQETFKLTKLYDRGIITRQEQYNNGLDAWAHCREQIDLDLRHALEERALAGPTKQNADFHSLMEISSHTLEPTQLRSLCGMIGLSADSFGVIRPIPIRSNLREGLRRHEYWWQLAGSRHAMWSSRKRAASVNRWKRRLSLLLKHIVVTMYDCGTVQSTCKSSLCADNHFWVQSRPFQSLAQRVEGRVSAETIINPVNEEIVVSANQLVTKSIADKIEMLGIEQLTIRSPATCHATDGVCALCYGMDPATQSLVEVGSAVGVHAASALTEALRHPDFGRLRLFWWGIGYQKRPFTREDVQQSRYELEKNLFFGDLVEIKPRHCGRVVFSNLDVANQVVLNDGGDLEIYDDRNRALEKYPLPPGTELSVHDGDAVLAGQKLASFFAWCDRTVAKHAGTASFRWDGSSLGTNWQSDDQIDIRAEDLRYNPRIEICDESNNLLDVHYLGAGCRVRERISHSHTITIRPGDILAERSRMPVRRDATSRAEKLVRLEELLLLRRPPYQAKLAPVDGRINQIVRQSYRRDAVHLESNGGERKVLIPSFSRFVSPGDTVQCGDLLSDGTPSLADVLRYQGFDKAVRYFCDEVKWLFRSNRIELADQHIELIAARMLRRARITDPGDSGLPRYQLVDRQELYRINQQLVSEQPLGRNRRQAVGERIITSLAQTTPRALSTIPGTAIEVGIPWSRFRADKIWGRLTEVGTGQNSLRSSSVVIRPCALAQNAEPEAEFRSLADLLGSDDGE